MILVTGGAGFIGANFILDWLAGCTEPLGAGRIISDYVRQIGGTPEATVVGADFKTSVPNAAFANGTMAHALDFDNTWNPPNHPTSPTLPAILALAEKHNFSGAAVIEKFFGSSI